MQTVRVFISSTFTDFSLERDILHNRVFPKIRDLCANHGCEFQAIDLRWGITERDSRDYSTLDICLEEVIQCQRVTPRPNFIFLSGSKYGWRPLPRRIPRNLFHSLLSSLHDSEKSALLSRSYRQDDNSPDGDYVLAGLAGVFNESVLRGILWEAVGGSGSDDSFFVRKQPSFTEEDKTLLFASATHLELLKRLSLPDFRDAAICAVRTLKNVPQDKLPLYFDTLSDNSVDSDAQREAVKTGRKAEESCPDTYHYELDLADPDKALEGFADYVYTRMEKHILGELENHAGSELADEVSYHRKELEEHVRFFRGRDQELAAALEQIRSGKKLLSVIGARGCGKTAFMSALASLAERAGRRIFFRSVGLTGNSADIRKLSEELKAELSADSGSAPENRVLFLDGIDKARNPKAFLRAAVKLTGDYGCVILSMADDFIRGSEDLLPGNTPALILELPSRQEAEQILSAFLQNSRRLLTPAQKSCLLGAFESTRSMHVFHALMVQSLKWRSFDAPLSPDEAVRKFSASVKHGSSNLPPVLTEHLRLYLAASREGLTGAELQGALSRDRDVLEEFLRLSEHLLPGTEGIIREYLEKSGLHPSGNEEIIRWLHSGKSLSGLSDALLASDADILLPYAYFSRALYDFMPALRESLSQGQHVHVIEPGLFSLAGNENGNALKMYHSRLADYFLYSEKLDSRAQIAKIFSSVTGHTGPSRLAVELPYQYLKAERYDDLYAFLCDPERLVFMDRWDRAEFASLWKQLKEHGDYDMAKGYAPLLSRAKALAEGGGDPGSLNRLAVEALVALLSSWGGFRQEVSYLNDALLKITAGGDADLHLQSMAQKALTMMEAGLFKEALDFTENALLQIPETVSCGYCDLVYAYSVALFRLERYPEAAEVIDKGYEIAQKLGNKDRIQTTLKWKASCAKVTGKAEEAEAIYAKLEEEYEQDEDKRALIATCYERASSAFLFEGNREKAFDLLDQAARYARETGQRSWLVQIYKMGMDMTSVSRDYPGLMAFSLKYLDTWAEVNPGQCPPYPEVISFLIGVTKTNPTAENLFMMESCMPMLAGGIISADDPALRDYPYRYILVYLCRTALSWQPEELRKVVRTITPAPKVFMETFDKGIEKFGETLTDTSRKNLADLLREFDALACKSVLGEPLSETPPAENWLSEKKTLEMRTSLGILLLYYGFDAASRVHDAVGAQQAEFTIQVHMLLFQENYKQFRETMAYNEYQSRVRNHPKEKERFDRYDEESKGDMAGESDLVKSLIEKLKKQ